MCRSPLLRSVLALGLVLCLHSAVSAYHVRVSIKFILDQNGNRPMGNFSTNSDVILQILRANSALCSSGSSMRIVLDELVDLGGLSGFATWPCSSNHFFEMLAKANKSAFRWRNNAVNVYITGNSCSGRCSFLGNEIIMIGQGANNTTLMHELGHYFQLYHTHGKTCDGNSSCGSCFWDDDGLSSTLLDAPCWSQNMIASWNYNTSYGALSASKKTKVDQTFFNIMSYHGTRNIFTSQQVSIMDFYAIVYRNHVVNISGGGPCFTLFAGLDQEPSPEEIDDAFEGQTTYERYDVPAELAELLQPLPGDELRSEPFVPGDVNDSTDVTVEDSLVVFRYLFSGGAAPRCEDAADFNDDGAVNLTDGLSILLSVVSDAPTPRGLPLGVPTFDRTEDSLGCELPEPAPVPEFDQ